MWRIDQALKLVHNFSKEAGLDHRTRMSNRNILNEAFQAHTDNPNSSPKHVIIEIGGQRLRALFCSPLPHKQTNRHGYSSGDKSGPTKRADSKSRVDITFPFERE